MSTKRSLSLILALLCVSLVSRASVASPSSEIQWIGSIPGVTLGTCVDQGQRCENIYTVAGSTASAMQAIRARLSREGWALSDPSSVSSAAGAIRGLTGHKGGRTIQVTGHEAGGIGGLVVHYTTGGPSQGGHSPSRPSGGRVTDEPVVAQGPSVQSSGDVTLDEGNQHQTYRMEGGTMVINSSNNKVVVTGRCKAVVINGGHNHVSVQCRVGQIQLNGSWNKVQWSRSKNPNPPECTNWGMDNKITQTD